MAAAASDAPAATEEAAGAGSPSKPDEEVPEAYAKLEGTDFVAYVTKLPVLLGRGSDATKGTSELVKLDDAKVSRQHAKISYNARKNQFEMEVLGKNGVTVNSAFYKKGSVGVALLNQSAVKVGSKKFYFLTPQFPRPEATYSELIKEAFDTTGAETMTVDEICVEIVKKYKYYRDKIKSLKACVRSSIQAGEVKSRFSKSEVTVKTATGADRKKILWKYHRGAGAGGASTSTNGAPAAGTPTASGEAAGEATSESGAAAPAAAAATATKRADDDADAAQPGAAKRARVE